MSFTGTTEPEIYIIWDRASIHLTTTWIAKDARPQHRRRCGYTIHNKQMLLIKSKLLAHIHVTSGFIQCSSYRSKEWKSEADMKWPSHELVAIQDRFFFQHQRKWTGNSYALKTIAFRHKLTGVGPHSEKHLCILWHSMA